METDTSPTLIYYLRNTYLNFSTPLSHEMQNLSPNTFTTIVAMFSLRRNFSPICRRHKKYNHQIIYLKPIYFINFASFLICEYDDVN